jgi:mannose-6-phosphate isomerase-like protein (cupin superfamily)
MLIRTLNDAELTAQNGIRYQSIELLGAEEPSTLGFGWAVVPPKGRTAGHSHPEPEYYVILKGRGTMRVNGESAPIAANQAAFIPSGQHHQISNEQDSELVYLAIYWHPELAQVFRAPGQP